MGNFELPHELLLRRYSLNVSQLSNHTRQLKTDLDKVLGMILAKSRNGKITMTPATKNKIETYDRYICDGIFEYLENENVISENQHDSIENQMDNQRESILDKVNTGANPNQQTTNQPQPQNKQSKSSSEGGDAKIGFWDWS